MSSTPHKNLFPIQTDNDYNEVEEFSNDFNRPSTVRMNQRVFFQPLQSQLAHTGGNPRVSRRLLPSTRDRMLRDLHLEGYNPERVQSIQANHPLNTIKGLNQGFTKRFEYKDQVDKQKPKPLVQTESSFDSVISNTVKERFGALWLDLTERTYTQRSIDQILADGWRVTQQKIAKDLESLDCPDVVNKIDLLTHYETQDEHEVCILMPIPPKELQLALIQAFDLNPLLQLELRHAFNDCVASSFVSPRQNKAQRNRDS